MKHLRQIIILVVFSIIGQQNISAQFNTLGREYPITSFPQKKNYQLNSLKKEGDSSVHIVPKEIRIKNTMERPMISLPLKKIRVRKGVWCLQVMLLLFLGLTEGCLDHIYI